MDTIKKYLKNYWWKYIIVALVLTFDMLTKALFVPQNEAQWKSYSLIGNFLWLKPLTNSGAGFSILEGKVWILIAITFVFIIILAIFDITYKHKSVLFGISTSLILSGAIGNLIDRLFLGYVRDFLYFKFIEFPVFNIADASLSIGVLLMFIYIIFFAPSDAQQNKTAKVSVIKQSIGAFEEKSQKQDEILERKIDKSERIKSAQKKQQVKVKNLENRKKSLSKKNNNTTAKKSRKKNILKNDSEAFLIANKKKQQIEKEVQMTNTNLSQFNEDDLREVIENKTKDNK